MAFSKYNKDRPFLVINRSSKPAEGENTSAKNWGTEGKMVIDEEVLIVDRVTNKHMVQAAVIVDILQRKMVKNRFVSEASNEEVLKHYLTSYKEHITDGIQTWMRGKSSSPEEAQVLIDELQSELDKIEIEVVADD